VPHTTSNFWQEKWCDSFEANLGRISSLRTEKTAAKTPIREVTAANRFFGGNEPESSSCRGGEQQKMSEKLGGWGPKKRLIFQVFEIGFGI
jgi:hypothetical protein